MIDRCVCMRDVNIRKINRQQLNDKLDVTGGSNLASTHPKINLSVSKYKYKEGLGDQEEDQ